MPRPPAFDKKDAIRTAMEAFWQDGYEATSVKSLSEKLGITRSSFYNAFGNREALFEEVFALYCTCSPDRPLHEETPKGSICVLITRTFREICRVRANDPDARGCMIVNGLCEVAGGANEVGPLLTGGVLNSVERLRELLEIAVARGELSEDIDLVGTATALQMLMLGLNVMARTQPREDDLWQATRCTLEGLGIYREETDA